MIRLSGIFTIIPATILLTISFFVLFAVTKIESIVLKNFGKVVAALLWISAGLFLLMGCYILVTGHHPIIDIMTEWRSSFWWDRFH